MKVVIFDMDGVLADTQEILTEARKDFYAKHQITPAILKGIYHLNFKEKIEHLNTHHGKEIDFEEAVAATRPKLMQLAVHARPKPGAIELVHALKGKRKLAVATSAGKHYCETVLNALGLADAFDLIMTSHDVEHPKPHPEIFQRIMQHFQATPEECVVIDDGVGCIKTARQLGMHVIGVQCAFATAADFAGITNRVVKDLTELRPEEL